MNPPYFSGGHILPLKTGVLYTKIVLAIAVHTQRIHINPQHFSGGHILPESEAQQLHSLNVGGS